MKTHEDTDRHPTDLKSARMNYPNSTMQPFVLQNASVDFQYPKPALSYMLNRVKRHVIWKESILDFYMLLLIFFSTKLSVK